MLKKTSINKGLGKPIILALFILLLTACNSESSSELQQTTTSEFILPNGDHYKGEFKDAKFHGHGTLKSINGTNYVGQFKQGLISGSGILTDSNGARYEGEFENGDYHGKGKYTLGDEWYIGTFENGSMVGHGEYMDYRGAHYKGEVVDWLANGEGELKNSDGVIFKGVFKDGLLNGEGGVTTANGNVYKGAFKGGKYHGQGVLTFKNGSVYSGEFAYGRYEGKGTLTVIKSAPSEIKTYQGRWRNNALIYNEATGEHFSDQAEIALERHQMLLNSHLLALKDSEKESPNVYFLGVAGDGKQSVFRREIEKVAASVNARYNTQGRSISLINHHDSAGIYPMATRRSVAASINAIGQKMNAEQDVLFLYLSSHGSKNFHLSLQHDSISLPNLNAQDLKESFEKANIKWKVIMISACYAGGFIPDLADDYTLIMTAADSKNTSFGCSEASMMTYFGKAMFNEVLDKDSDISLSDAFANAKKLIEQWESEKGLPSSKPMLSAPIAIVEKLASLKVN